MSTLDTALPPAAEGLETAPAAEPASRAVFAPTPWSPLTRLGFRICFIYFICFMYLYGNDGIDFQAIVIWRWMSDALNWPMNVLGTWAAHSIFHITGIRGYWRVTHRGDTIMNWVLDRVFIAGAIAGGLIWTAVARLRGNRRKEYWTLLAWLRFFLRLAVGFFMIGYGFIKVFPLQMPPIPVAVLNQPIGSATGHTILWTMVGLHPWYESFCGIAEVIGGTLVLFRRTALVGTLICIFIMSNVVMYNLFFDVSVKLFAVNLLLAEIFLVLPDTQRLFTFFWRHEPAAPTGGWVPLDTRWQTRFFVRTLEVSFIVGSFAVGLLFNGIKWQHERVVARIPSPMIGAWHLDSTHRATGAFVVPEGPVTEMYVDTVDRAYARTESGALWRYGAWVNPTAHTFYMNPYSGNAVTYRWQMPDANHLTLIPIAPTKQKSGSQKSGSQPAPDVVTFTRTPLPAHYRLLDPRFHFVMFGIPSQ